MKKTNFIIPILTFILCFVMMTGAYGDLGDFNDYDSGYDGGGGFDYGGGYDDDYNYGGNSRINGLDQYLETTLGVKVERVCSMSNIDISLDVNIADILLAAGSLLRR